MFKKASIHKNTSRLVSCILFISLVINNFYANIASSCSIECLQSKQLNVIVLFICFSISLITCIKENLFFKLLQIFNLFALGTYSVFTNDLSDPVGIIFLSLALMLTWTYFDFKKKPLLMLPILITVYAFLKVGKIYSDDLIVKVLGVNTHGEKVCNVNKIDQEWQDDLKILNVIDGVYFLVFVALFIRITLVEEIKLYFDKSNKIEKELNQNEHYIWYGKNINGVIHNIKNKLTPIYLLLGEIKEDETIDEDLRNFSEMQLNNSEGIIELLDQLLCITRNKSEDNIKDVNVNKVMKSILEFFKSNLYFKNNVKLDIKEDGDLIVKTIPLELTQVFENIIKNSLDELKKKNENRKIDIEINSKEKFVSIKDNGSGIKKCMNCKNKKCFYSCDAFKIGETTKENGLGYGMTYIKNYIVKNKLDGKIISNNNGTEIIIYFKN